MIHFQKVKKLLIKLRLYQLAHRIYAYTLNRSHLKKLQVEKEFYRNFINTGDLCFDIGANLGNKTAVFLDIGAKVVSVEPQPDCIEILKAKFRGNNNFICVDKGVGEKPDKLKLYTRKQNLGAASFISEWEGDIEEEIEVDVTTLDMLISSYGHPKFCKIDVEGFELSVLKGLTHPIDILSFEYHLIESDIQKTIDCIEYLSQISEAEIQLNVIPGEGKEIKFARQDWWDKQSFIEFFRNDLPKIPGFGYFGDIFVQMS